MSRRTLLASLAITTTAGATLVATALPAAAAVKPADRAKPPVAKDHAVFLASNDTAGNTIGVFARGRDGRLQAVHHYATGGIGADLPGAVADPLASQGGLTYDAKNQLLYAVNGGSNTLTVFKVDGLRLTRLQILDTRGVLPTSVAVGHDLVYVLDASGDGAVTGFRVVGGRLVRLAGSTRSLSLGNVALPNFLADPAQVAVTPSGSAVIVTTKTKNTIISFALDNKGVPSATSVVTPSAAPVPFSMAFDQAGRLLVNEASGSESTYTVNPDATLSIIATHVSNNGQAGACWSAVAKGFIYTGNSGSATITAYTEDANGGLTLHDASGVAATTGGGPVDIAVSQDGQFLYQLANLAGAIDEFHVNDDGSLSPLGTVAGLTIANGSGSQGLAAS
jgi:6-phosphogluconolactonase (cycloisomerase 2 family)